MALAMATRLCCPPEREFTEVRILSCRPTASTALRVDSLISAEGSENADWYRFALGNAPMRTLYPTV
uniref:Uncharacterized protein n=1 Tax=uncultured marine group II/III euryarchaeote KM3_190_A02 TaxID=1457958 RepID=A0A075GWF1_9EURY|nr:hypothetical protein [uncultured marine group II/III euryarchaeote KM3_190_A02]